ncbi:OmpP1/FadL family transporter [Pedobacter sp. AW31-3R]|uniref:OmpP1/FadL family transporter n=1 Tax=Pedobacter sp. AW31-3R TaxID=3445781 RepID=UPI003FA14F05
MKKFIQLLVLATVASTGNIYAQAIAGDALRFSRTDYGSSARFKGLGNAQISLGGDISSIGGNPAGLGMFTRSEFSITPEFNGVQSNASYLGQNTKTTKNRLNLNQAAAVWYNPIVKAKGSDLNTGLISFVGGIGYNRNNDFSGEFNYNGVNQNNSFADDLAQRANGYSPANLPGVLNMAHNSFLIDQLTGQTQYAPATSLPNTQNSSDLRSGSTSELNFSGALNFSNKFYLGGSIGFVSVRYQNDRLYRESGSIIDPGTAQNPTEDNPQLGRDYDLAYRSSQNTDGAGINAKLGLIYKPVNEVRIGATFQSPTWMHFEETFDEVLDANFSQNGNLMESVRNDIDYTDFNYNLRTPYKGSVGASVILGQNALISADVDYVDYGSTRLSVSDGFRDIINDNNAYIKQNYTSAINYRVGAEYKIDKFTVRGGYGVNGTPYKFDDDNLSQIKYYSGGIGYRVSQYYVDLAYQRQETHNTFSPYELDNADEIPQAAVKVARNNVFLTVGIRF